MHRRFAVALAWGGMTAVVAGCSSGKDAGVRTDSAAATAAPVPPGGIAPAALTNDITAAEIAWRIAVTGGDTVELGRITAPEFTMVGATGPASTVTRATLMKQISQGMLQADSSTVTDLKVSGVADSASADLTFFWRVSRMGKPPKPETMKVTDSWVKRDGRWQLASRHERSAP
jgi:hypothetical protein